MSMKIQSRFAPSILRAAAAVEAMHAYFDRAANATTDVIESDALAGAIRMNDDAEHRLEGYRAPGDVPQKLLAECLEALRSERVQRAHERRLRQEALERERARVGMLIAA